MDLTCKRCLVREMGQEDMQRRIRHAINIIPQESRCAEEVYRRRLSACRECEKLLSGICRVCGCFVEVRAARAESSCPGIPDKWAV